jgi:ribosome-binding protein aMBF1 (putative translation factor)
MPDTTFKLLEDQIKESGSAYWVCRPCQNFGQRIKKPVRGEQQETDRWNRKRDR